MAVDSMARGMAAKALAQGGSQGGTSNYEDLTNKPKINNVEIVGNTTSEDLGLVSKQNNKGLSTNDFTDEDKENLDNNTLNRHNHSNKSILDNTTASFTTTQENKLRDIENGAEVNVNADWNENDETNDAFIKNKPTKLSEFTNDENFIKSTVDNLVNYYNKSNSYSKDEINTLIGNIKTITIQVVDELPTEDIATNVIYFTPKNPTQDDNLYDEYINLDGTTDGWEKIGDTKVDLSDYYTKEQTDDLLLKKVDSIEGKELSSNDFTDEDKQQIETNKTNIQTNTEAIETKQDTLIKSASGSNLTLTDSKAGTMLLNGWTKNLLNPTLAISTQNGITCTNNGDGTYTLNGTSNNVCFFWLITNTLKLPKGTYKLVGHPRNGNNDYYIYTYDYKFVSKDSMDTVATIDMDDYTNSLLIRINSGVTLTNEVIKPMITTNLTATYDDYVSYEGYEVMSCGKNLFDKTKITKDAYIVYDTGEISSSTSGACSTDYISVKNGKLFLSGNSISSYSGGAFYDSTKTFIDGFDSDIKKGIDVPINAKFVRVSLKQSEIDTTQIELGTQVTSYEPYQSSKVKVSNDTPAPQFLDSYNGTTNIISPSDLSVSYAVSDDGKSLVDSVSQKEDILLKSISGSNITIENTKDGTMLLNGWTKNLLNPTLAISTQNGITCTNNGDGTYTLNGTSNNVCFFWLITNTLKLPKGTYKLVGHPRNGNNDYYIYTYDYKFVSKDSMDTVATIDMDDYTNSLLIRINSGVTLTNEVIKPMITTNLTATYDDYVSYEGYEVMSCGKNLFDKTKITKDAYIVYDTGEISSSTSGACSTDYISVKNGKLFLSGNSISSYSGGAFYDSTKTFIDGFDSDIKKGIDVPINAKFVRVSLKQSEIDTTQIELGTQVTSYEPYQSSSVTVTNDTVAPLALKSFDDVTNIISPSDVDITYGVSENGIKILSMANRYETEIDNIKKAIVALGGTV